VTSVPQAEPPSASALVVDARQALVEAPADPLVSRGPSPAPKRGIELSLETRRATILYWTGVALCVAALFVTKLLPCVDYPQHLALSDIARRLADPSAPEHAEYRLNYFTYNGLFHFVVAWLSHLVPIELAGRIVVAASLVAMAAAVVALLRVLKRPPVHAALFTPILFSFSVGWGFVNYVLATAIAAWALVFVARAATRPTVLDVAAVAVLGGVCAFAHVLAMLILCLAAAAVGLEVAWRSTQGTGAARVARTLARATIALGPLLLGCLYCIAVYRVQYRWDPAMYRDPTLEGTAPPVWAKVLWFTAYSTDLFWDATDQVLLAAAIFAMGWTEWLAYKRRRAGQPADSARPLVLPFLALFGAYLATPMVLVGTHLIFPRLGQWAILGAVLAIPRVPAEKATRAAKWFLGIGVATGANLVLHCAIYAWETNDASRVIDDLPPGRAATAVIWEPGTFAFRNGTLTHLAAYYAARKHGQWAFAFARYLSVPVRFQPGSQPAWPAHGWEFDAPQYDPRCKYARAFPLVIVKAPRELPRDASAEGQVRALVFKKDAAAVRLLSHHGRYWAFDTTGLPDDGTL
jgi:hypothetical protein